jgi:cytochrome c biogenesis protein CcmG/thiol:disulfide interchange protein DsbE
MQQAGASMPVLLDPQGDVAGKYGVAAVPTAVIIDKQGKIADIKVGPTTAADLESAVNALK